MFKRKQKQRSRFDRKIDVEEVYVDKNGNKWYAYVNPMTIPAKRAIAAEIATRFAEMNLTKASFKVLVEEMKKKANEGNIVELFQLLAEIEFRLEFLGEEETLKELACCYFLLNDEDESDFNDVYKNMKLNIWKEDEECKYFFIQGAFILTHAYSNLSEIDIQEYLVQNVPNVDRLNQIIQILK
jgi:hypothetical protein